MDKLRKKYLKLNFRERSLLFLCSLVLALLLFKLLILDEFAKMSQLRLDVADLKRQISQSDLTLKQLREDKNEAEANAGLMVYKKENSGQAALMKALSAAEKMNDGFSLRKIASEKAEKNEEVEKSTFQMEVEAPFVSIGAFLESLENSKLLTRVESVQIFRTEKELKLCRAKIVVDSYSWREP